MSGFLPYLLPILGPFLGLMLVLSLGPWAFQRITTFIREQINTALGRQIQVHYHQLDLADQGYDVPDDSPPLEAA